MLQRVFTYLLPDVFSEKSSPRLPGSCRGPVGPEVWHVRVGLADVAAHSSQNTRQLFVQRFASRPGEVVNILRYHAIIQYHTLRHQ